MARSVSMKPISKGTLRPKGTPGQGPSQTGGETLYSTKEEREAQAPVHKRGALGAREAAGGQQEASSPLEQTVPGGEAEPRKPGPGPGGDRKLKGAHQTPISLRESRQCRSREEAKTRLPGLVKQEGIKTSPHTEIPVEVPGEPGARDCN